MPVRIELIDAQTGKATQRAWFNGYTMHESGAWHPDEIIVEGINEADVVFTKNRMSLVDIKINEDIDDSIFELDIPENTLIADMILGLAYRYENGKRNVTGKIDIPRSGISPPNESPLIGSGKPAIAASNGTPNGDGGMNPYYFIAPIAILLFGLLLLRIFKKSRGSAH